jgi:hypothetical protein
MSGHNVGKAFYEDQGLGKSFHKKMLFLYKCEHCRRIKNLYKCEHCRRIKKTGGKITRPVGKITRPVTRPVTRLARPVARVVPGTTVSTPVERQYIKHNNWGW